MSESPRSALPRWREVIDQRNPQALLHVMARSGLTVPQPAAGGRGARMTCCFHEGAQGKNLSLFPDQRTGGWRYHCKVCQAHGRAIEFLAARQHLRFYAALQELGRREGPDGQPLAPIVAWTPQQWKGIHKKLLATGERVGAPPRAPREPSPLTALYQRRVTHLWQAPPGDPAHQAARAYATRRAQRAGVPRDTHEARTRNALDGKISLWPGLLDTGDAVWSQLTPAQRTALEDAGVPSTRNAPVYLWPHRNRQGDVIGLTATPAPTGEAPARAPDGRRAPVPSDPVCWGATTPCGPVADPGPQKFTPVVVTRSPWFAMSVAVRRGGGVVMASRPDQLAALPPQDQQHLLLVGDSLDQPRGKRWLRTMTYGAMRTEGDVAITRPPDGDTPPDPTWVARAWETRPDPLEYVLRQANQLEEPLRSKVLAERLPPLWARTRQPALRAAYADIVQQCLGDPDVQQFVTAPPPRAQARHAADVSSRSVVPA